MRKTAMLLIAAAAVLFFSAVLASTEQELKVRFFNVGQGDAAFIRTPDGRNILIDGGPDASVLAGLGRVMPWWDRAIDLMILTHPHDDHAAGLAHVLERYDTRRILYPGTVSGSPIYADWLDKAKKEGAGIIVADKETEFRFGPDCALKTIHPHESLAGREEPNPNLSSIVAKLDCSGRTYLFTGDIEEKIEKDLVSRRADLRADVLKLPHHGSDTSSSGEFLKAVSPRTAVISVGKNDFGHPSLRVLNRLEDAGIKTERTDIRGDLEL
jgi:competence protein ComEC